VNAGTSTVPKAYNAKLFLGALALLFFRFRITKSHPFFEFNSMEIVDFSL
jgi:hypothetical protein